MADRAELEKKIKRMRCFGCLVALPKKNAFRKDVTADSDGQGFFLGDPGTKMEGFHEALPGMGALKKGTQNRTHTADRQGGTKYHLNDCRAPREKKHCIKVGGAHRKEMTCREFGPIHIPTPGVNVQIAQPWVNEGKSAIYIQVPSKRHAIGLSGRGFGRANLAR